MRGTFSFRNKNKPNRKVKSEIRKVSMENVEFSKIEISNEKKKSEETKVDEFSKDPNKFAVKQVNISIKSKRDKVIDEVHFFSLNHFIKKENRNISFFLLFLHFLMNNKSSSILAYLLFFFVFGSKKKHLFHHFF